MMMWELLVGLLDVDGELLVDVVWCELVEELDL